MMGMLTHKREWLIPWSSKLLFERCRRWLPWGTREVVIYGRRVAQPRLVCLVGRGYGYSGARMAGGPVPSWLLDVVEAVSAQAGVEFNSVLCNLYRGGSDSIGWHSDDEAELGTDPVVASLSLGAGRRFCTRLKGGGPASSVMLEAGDLLVMPAGFQGTHQHSMPKTTRAVGERISLTFRKLV